MEEFPEPETAWADKYGETTTDKSGTIWTNVGKAPSAGIDNPDNSLSENELLE